MKRKSFSRFMGPIVTVVMTSVMMAFTLIGSSALAQSFRELLLVDANDKVIGVARSAEATGSSVAFEYMGKVYVFSVYTNTFEAEDGKWLYFESTNCSGTPYISDNNTMGAPAAVVPPGNQVYIPISASSSQSIIPKSYINIYQEGTCGQSTYSQEINAFPAHKLIDLNTVFTPPFRYRFSD